MKNFLKKLNETDIRHIAAIIIILGVFSLVFMLHFVKVPEANLKIVERATDQLIVLGFAVVVGYLFMSQKRDKQILPPPPPPPPLSPIDRNELMNKLGPHETN